MSVVVGNLGYLPTNLTDEAVNQHVSKPVTVEIQGGELLSGKKKEEIGNLSGYSRTVTGAYFYGNLTTETNAPARKKISWLVKGDKGTEITISCSQEKSGSATKSVVL